MPDLRGKVRCEEFGRKLTEIGGEVVDIPREESLGVVVGSGVNDLGEIDDHRPVAGEQYIKFG